MEYDNFKKWADENLKSRDQLLRQLFEWMTQLDLTKSALLDYEQRLQLYFYIIEFQAKKLKSADAGDYSNELNIFIQQKSINLHDKIIKEEKLIRDGMIENANLAIRENKSKLQSIAAKKKRPKKNHEKKSLNEIIHNILKTHPDERPSELWVIFQHALSEWSDSDVKQIHANSLDQKKYLYDRPNGKNTTISYGQFRKKVAIIKKNGI